MILINIGILILSLLGLYYLDYPLELIPMGGIAWVLLWCFGELIRLRLKK